MAKKEDYVLQDALKFCVEAVDAERFSKAVCYGSFAYFDFEYAELMLKSLYENFINIKTIFIGNCPDKDLAMDFFKRRNENSYDLNDHTSAIGVWRTQKEFKEMLSSSGWDVEFKRMPPKYFAANYRYDVVLTRG